MHGSVVSFQRSQDGEIPVDGDHILEYLESHAQDGIIREINCRQVLDDAALTRLDAFLRQNHARIHLQRLFLPQNKLTEASAESLKRILEQTSETLVELDLSDNPLRPTGLAYIVDALAATAATGGSTHSRLERLDISNTQIGVKGMASVATLLRFTDSIRELQLSHNNLGTKSMKTLSSILCNENATLEVIGLAYNKLKDRGAGFVSQILNPNISNSPLTELDLSNNGISYAGAEQLANALLQGNSNLKKLDLGYNTIGPIGASSIGQMLRFTHSLEKLVLTGNEVGDDGVQALSEGLKESSNNADSRLHYLDLDWNDVTDVGAGHLAEVLLGNNSLKSLSLAHNSIGDRGAVAMADALPSDLALQRLDLSSNQIGDYGATYLAKVLCRPRCAVILLWEDNNLTSQGISRLDHVQVFRKSIASWLGRQLELIEQRPSLSIQLLPHSLGDVEITVLSSHLAKYKPTVPAIFAGGRGITGQAIQQLAKLVLTDNAVKLHRLYLQTTNISDFGAGVLSQSLLFNSTLTVLSLANCNITHNGAEKLANGLRRNSTLKRLDLKQNSIHDPGILSIMTAIQNPSHPSLVSLNVGSNEISDYGLSTVTSFACLEELHLGNNNITDYGALDLAKVCLEEHSLRWLTLSGNRLSPKGIQALAIFLSSALLDSDDQQQEG